MMRNHRFHAVCTLAVAAALVALPGCGSSQTDNYKKDVAKAGNDFKNSAQAASQQVQAAQDKNGKVQGLEALKASVNKAADDFSKLSPPSKAKSANDALVTELRALAGDVDAVENALKTTDALAAKAALPKLQADEAKISTTIADLQSKIGK
ncbi:MAG: hypothetical protein QOK25_10 [Thermoleophilaceae bacterium]|jgi:hypothetical protein|nr:hypothetical protein [Thermoleophilaceae bacterium]